MKYLFLLGIVIFNLGAIAQTNFLIEYDKLADKTTFFRGDWVKGAQKFQKVNEIKLNQNDIVQFRIVNVNNFVYKVDIAQGETRLNTDGSPFNAILSTFAPFGGGALRMFSGLANDPPSSFTASRGGNKEENEYKERCSNVISNVHSLMTKITKTYAALEKAIEVKYSKTKTKDQILSDLRLKLNNEDFSSEEMEEAFEELLILKEELDSLSQKEVLDYDDPFFNDIDKAMDSYGKFAEINLTDDGQLKPYDLLEVISEIENNSFVVEHRFLASADGNASNDFVIVFEELPKEEGDNSDFDPIIDHSKSISIPIRQPNLPYWAAGVDFVVASGGINEYNVLEISGDENDSLMITTASSKSMQLSIGTKLVYDLKSKNRFFTPNILAGIALSGFNSGDYKINFMLGGGVTLKQFPYVSLNAGLVFNQQKVLRNEYYLNRSFVKPTGYSNYSPDPAILFKNTFKPGLFFGVNLRL
jgi:hypothetical protein